MRYPHASLTIRVGPAGSSQRQQPLHRDIGANALSLFDKYDKVCADFTVLVHMVAYTEDGTGGAVSVNFHAPRERAQFLQECTRQVNELRKEMES